jgi:bacteriorhodopsin
VVGVDPLLLLLPVTAEIDLHSTGPAWLWDVAGVLALVAALVVLLRWWSSHRRR